MNPDTQAELEAAFAIEAASCPSIRALLKVVSREHVFMAWSLGYLTGKRHAFSVALAMHEGKE